MKLKAKILLSFVAVTGVSLLAVSFLGYFYAKEKVAQNINAEMDSVVNAHANQLEGWLFTKARTVESIANIGQNGFGDEAIPQPYVELYKSDKDLLNVFLGTDDGRYLAGPVPDLPPGWDHRTRSWYQQAKAKGGLVFTDAYVDSATKKYVVTAAVPLKNSAGITRGAAGIDISLATLNEIIKEVKINGQGYGFIVDSNGILLAHPDESKVSTNLADNTVFKDIFNEMLKKDQGSLRHEVDGVVQWIIYHKIPATGWILAITVPEEIAYSQLNGLKFQYIIVNIIGILAAIACAFFLSNRLTKPLVALAGSAHEIACGDLTVRNEVSGQDEVADLGNTFNMMAASIQKLIRNINSAAEVVSTAAVDMKNSSAEAGHVSEQIAGSVTELAAGTSDQSDSNQKSARMVDDITNDIRVISENAQSSAQLAEQVDEAVALGYEAVLEQTKWMEENKHASANVSAAVGALEKNSIKIGQIVEVIAGIAGQTNLLALNAAIEAARAGEHGRGFAVVAEEVRKLAEQSATSSQEIADLIKEIQNGTAQAVAEMATSANVVTNQAEAVNKTQGYFDNIKNFVSKIVEQIDQMACGAEKLNEKSGAVASGITNVAAVSEEIASSIQEVAAATQEQSATIQSIASEADKLLQESQKLKSEVEKFKA